ncbi:hypothetical protein Tco_0700407 [Tanacetum coccineum]
MKSAPYCLGYRITSIAGLMLMTMESEIQRNLEEGQSVSSYVLKMKGYIDNLERLGHPVTLGLAVSLILIGLRKEFDGTLVDGTVLSTSAELLREKEVHPLGWRGVLGLRASRKLKPGALSLYVGNGQREAVEAIGNFDLSLLSGFVICYPKGCQTTLPKSFWDYALESDARILNMVPTKEGLKSTIEVTQGIQCFSLYLPTENNVLVARNAEFPKPNRSYNQDSKWESRRSLKYSREDSIFYRPLLKIMKRMNLEMDDLNDSHMENSKRGSIPMQDKLRLSKSQGASTPAELKRNAKCDLHWTTVKNILKYLRNTKDMFLVYGGDLKRELRVSCYMVVDFWTVAEIHFWLGVVPTIEKPINMYCDNTGAIAIANESGITKGARHFRAKVHYLRENIGAKESEIDLLQFHLKRAQHMMKVYVDKNRSVRVAHSLNIKSLLDLLGKTFDGMLRGRSVAECSKILNMLNVFARGEQDIRRRPHGLLNNIAYLF